jgi:hypothetical protein
MHTLWVVGKPDFQENWAASVVSANKCFHLVGSYFVPSFVSPSLVKPTSNCFYCRCIQCFNIVTWSRLDQIHMHAFFPEDHHTQFCCNTIYTRNSFTWKSIQEILLQFCYLPWTTLSFLATPLNRSFMVGGRVVEWQHFTVAAWHHGH